MGIRCIKCKGLVVEDTFQEDRWVPGFRCVNCGRTEIDEEKVERYANQKAARRTNKLDELELYMISGRYIERGSYNIQHK